MIEQVKKYLIELQQTICSEIELLDGSALFEQDHWSREDQRGNGVTCIISNGNVLRRGE
jgi:Coproporphyrinogen III oxidase